MSIELKQAAQQAIEAIQDFRGYRPDIDKAIKALRTAIQQAEQPVTAIACGIPGMVKTTCPYCEESFAFEHEQPATTEPVYWEWRHLSTHPNTVDFGQWSEWQRVEARNAIHTIEGALAEFRTYIAQGYKYELRALYTHPAPSVPDGYVLVPIEPTQAMMNVQTWDFSSFYSPREIWAAMLAAK